MKEFFKKLLKSLLFDLGIVGLVVLGIGAYIFFYPEAVFAQVYQPLAPIPGVTDNQGAPDLNTYISNIYDISIGIGVVLAILMLVIAGFEYASTAISNQKSKARSRMTGAILGLLLLLSSVLILNTINPDLSTVDVGLDPVDTLVLPQDASAEERQALLEARTIEGVNGGDDLDEHAKNIEEGFERYGKECASQTTYVERANAEERAEIRNDLLKRCSARLNYVQGKKEAWEFRPCVIISTATGYGSASGAAEACFYVKK